MPEPKTAAWPDDLSVHRRLLASDATFGSVALAAAFDVLGDELFSWHPATVRMELQHELGIELPAETANRLYAAITVDSTDQFTANVGAFASLCNTLAGGNPTEGHLDLPGVAEVGWGVTEAMLLSPPEEGRKFDPQIVEYVKACLKDEGYDSVPDCLAAFRDEIDLPLPESSMTGDAVGASAEMAPAARKRENLDALVRETMSELVAQMAELMPKLKNKLQNKEQENDHVSRG